MTEYERQNEIEELKSGMGSVAIKATLSGLAIFGIYVTGGMIGENILLTIVIYIMMFATIYGSISSLWYFIKGLGNYIVGIIVWCVVMFGISFLFMEWASKGDDAIHIIGNVISFILMVVIGYGGFVKDFIKVIKLIKLLHK